MKLSSKKSIRFVPLRDNDPDNADDFNYGELEDSPLFEDELGECLRDAVNNYLRRQIFNMFMVFESMTNEERKALLGRDVFNKSFREIAREINRDKKTAQSRYEDARFRIRHSPLVKVSFERKRRED